MLWVDVMEMLWGDVMGHPKDVMKCYECYGTPEKCFKFRIDF
jgi:hypothetical protein